MAVQKLVIAFFCIFCIAFQCDRLQAKSLEEYNFRIIPREVQSIVSRLCDSTSHDAAQKAHGILAREGFDALMAQTRKSAEKDLEGMSQIKQNMWLKQTLMFAFAARNRVAGKSAQAALVKELNDMIFDTLNKLCKCISNLDKIIYLENGKVNAGAYEALLQKIDKVERGARTPNS